MSSTTMLQIEADTTLPAGRIVAVDVSIDDYIAQYADTHHEWVNGVVLRMSPHARIHNLLIIYLVQLLNAYFAVRSIGSAYIDGFAQRLADSVRLPDVLVILDDNPGEVTDSAMIGPADICIEIVSEESRRRDYGDKFVEYQQGGVGEYWIIDPLDNRAVFHRLTPSNSYEAMLPDEDGYYRTPLLPDFALPIATLWAEQLPDYFTIGEMVKAMLEEGT